MTTSAVHKQTLIASVKKLVYRKDDAEHSDAEANNYEHKIHRRIGRSWIKTTLDKSGV